MVAVNGVLGLAKRWRELSRSRMIMGIAVSVVPKSNKYSYGLLKTNQQIFLAIFIGAQQPGRVNPEGQMPTPGSFDYFGHRKGNNFSCRKIA